MIKHVQFYSILLSIILLIAIRTSTAQSERSIEVREAVKTRIENSDDYQENRKAIDAVIFAADPHRILEELTPFTHHDDPKIRRKAMFLTADLGGQASPGSEIRQQVVERLIEALHDGDISFNAYGQLLGFRAADFTEQAKNTIRQQLHPKYRYANQDQIMIIGVANMQDQVPMLRRIRLSPKALASLRSGEQLDFDGGPEWKARLALARMGSQEDIDYCIEMVESYPDITIRLTRLLNDLAYIRQPEIINVLQTYLNSDERIPRQGDVPPSDYWEYAIRLLANILEDFPVHSPWSYSVEQRDIARAWMDAQTEFTIKR